MFRIKNPTALQSEVQNVEYTHTHTTHTSRTHAYLLLAVDKAGAGGQVQGQSGSFDCGHLPAQPPFRAVPVVLHRVVGAPNQKLGDLRPAVAELFVWLFGLV
jgi:hypothetical protein